MLSSKPPLEGPTISKRQRWKSSIVAGALVMPALLAVLVISFRGPGIARWTPNGGHIGQGMMVIGAASPAGCPSPEVRLAVIGDYGVDNANELAVANLVKSWNPDFVVTAGDNNYPNGDAATIDANVGKYYHEFIGNYSGSYGTGAAQNRFFPSLGNHDWNSTVPGQPYLDYFTLPGNERYYTATLGSVGLFVVDSDPREPDGTSVGSTQAQWLQAQLAASTARWKLVIMHHAPYSSGPHGNSTWMQWPYAQWGATAVLAGHDHDYERVAVGGLPYFVNGMGGANLYAFGLPVPGSAVRFNSEHGAMRIEAASHCLSFQAVAASGQVIDSFTIADFPNSVYLPMTLREFPP